jgi:hypothetical protein
MKEINKYWLYLKFVRVGKLRETRETQVRPKKRGKPYLRYLWLDLNKTKTKINHFKNAISTTYCNDLNTLLFPPNI